jgi:hypothetical protein
MRERIVMGEIEPTPTHPRAPMIAAAAVAVLLVASAGVVVATRGTDKPQPGGGPITPGGGSAMCVEQYSLQTLKNRQVAFDGTVAKVSDDNVTFKVNEWFKGGSAAGVTLKGASTLGGITSAGPSISLDLGSRLLVAGDGGFAWSCGFTQTFSDSVAKQWRETLS